MLLNVTVHQSQLCENIPDEVRFACTDDAGTRRAIVAPLVVLIELWGNKRDFSPAFGLINRQMDQGTQDIYVRRGVMSRMWTWQVTSLSPNNTG